MMENPLKFLFNLILLLAVVGGLMKWVEHGQKKAADAKVAGEADASAQRKLKVAAEEWPVWASQQAEGFVTALERASGGGLGSVDLASLRSFQPKSNGEIFVSLNSSCKHGASPAGECLDPWGQPYQFAFNLEGSDWAQYGVYSFGPNKTDERMSGDDIAAWKTLPIKKVY